MQNLVRHSAKLAAKSPASVLTTRALSASAVCNEKYFDKILIANRGEIACRVMRTCKKLGIKTVAVHSEADANALHVRMADERYCIGPAPSSQSYLVVDNVMEAVRATGAQAVHPGYGFLSEKFPFCEALDKEGVAFIGPRPYALHVMGDKLESKRIANEAKVHTVPGFDGEVENVDHALELAKEIGYPVMIKAAAGGGGKGMRLAYNEKELRDGYRFSRDEALSSFADGRLLIERFVEKPRHIEIQVVADSHGNAVYLNERECSIQRRNQKVVEEAPSVFLDPKTRKNMGEQACALAKAVQYQSAGTVEFLVDPKKYFYFLEMNTRLQVEHPITECITGVDIVEQMIRVAAGKPLSITQDDIGIHGWAIESRVYAEDPFVFLPSTGRLTTYIEPKTTAPEVIKDIDLTTPHVRVDSGVYEGGEINMYYDPMICKLITHAKDRPTAIAAMKDALDSYVIKGVKHNIPLLRDIMCEERFISGNIDTNFIPEVYPEGFQGYKMTPDEKEQFFAGVASMHLQRLSLDSDASHITQLVVHAQGRNEEFDKTVDVEWADGKVAAFIVDGKRCEVSSNWSVGSPLFEATFNGAPIVIQHLGRRGFESTVRFCGTELRVNVRTKEEDEAFKLLPPKPAVDHSLELLTPMPGTIVSMAVAVGQEVLEGSEVAVMEAMKMQNKLLAPRSGIVKAVHAKVGEQIDGDLPLISFYTDDEVKAMEEKKAE